MGTESVGLGAWPWWSRHREHPGGTPSMINEASRTMGKKSESVAAAGVGMTRRQLRRRPAWPVRERRKVFWEFAHAELCIRRSLTRFDLHAPCHTVSFCIYANIKRLWGALRKPVSEKTDCCAGIRDMIVAAITRKLCNNITMRKNKIQK